MGERDGNYTKLASNASLVYLKDHKQSTLLDGRRKKQKSQKESYWKIKRNSFYLGRKSQRKPPQTKKGGSLEGRRLETFPLRGIRVACMGSIFPDQPNNK